MNKLQSFSKITSLIAVMMIFLLVENKLNAHQVHSAKNNKEKILVSTRKEVKNQIQKEIENKLNETNNYLLPADLLKPITKSTSLESAVSETDSTILVSLYNATNGDEWTNNENWLSGPISSWFGIKVESDEVTEIILKGNNLSGTIPGELGQLTSLKYLQLDTNNLSGSIPIELGQLTNLQYLYLNGNQLTDTIPSELTQISNLLLLYLNGNQLTGKIPKGIENLTNLRWLDLAKNKINGTIPSEFGQLSSVQFIDLSENQLTDTIPFELAQLTGLRWLVLTSNQLTGTIPSVFGQMTNLEMLYLDGNQLTGNIPAELNQLSSLIWLNLAENQLTGSFDALLTGQDSLSLLYLNGNQLSGPIPTGLSLLPELKWLNLSQNQFNGTIPSEIWQISNLSLLYLNGNQLKDTISPEVSQLTNLEWLDLGQNQLTGSFPAEISQMNRLKIVDIQSNQFDSLPDIILPDSLLSLYVFSNRFTFEDLEYNMDLKDSIEFIYSPQDSIGENQWVTKNQGEDFSYTISIGGEQNNFQWYKNGKLIDSQISATLLLNNITFQDSGKYYCEITNDTVSGLTLSSRALNLAVVDSNYFCNKLVLQTGWQIFSIPLNPGNTDLQTIFQPFIENGSLIKIQDESGRSLENLGVFGGWANNIGNVNPTEGYKIKMSIEDSIEICGTSVEYPFAIPLKKGWNIIGYPHTTPVDGMDAIVQDLIDRGTLLKVQDEMGYAIEYWDQSEEWINDIGNFIPGEGYKIKMSSDDTLWIHESYPKNTSVKSSRLRATTNFIPEFKGNGVDHMNINLVGLPLNLLQVGDEMALYDGEICVGAIALTHDHLLSQSVSIVASANDNDGLTGFEEGNKIFLKIWDSNQNTEFILEPEILRGNSTFTKNETTFASLEKYTTTGFEEILNSNLPEVNYYPNPFSDEITIEINLQTNSEIEVEVLNQLGQKVKSITTKQILNNGLHKITWDGRNSSNQTVSPGIYLLKFSFDGNMVHRKIVFSK